MILIYSILLLSEKNKTKKPIICGGYILEIYDEKIFKCLNMWVFSDTKILLTWEK